MNDAPARTATGNYSRLSQGLHLASKAEQQKVGLAYLNGELSLSDALAQISDIVERHQHRHQQLTDCWTCEKAGPAEPSDE